MENVELETSFAEDYRLSAVTVGADEEAIYFPGASRHEGRDGLAILVEAVDALTWIGVFAPSPAPVVGRPAYCSSHPDGSTFGVVNKGDGYVVDVRSPQLWSRIPVPALTEVVVSVESRMVVYVGLTDMCAYGANGLRWCRRSLSWDGIRIQSAADGAISGSYWDAPADSWLPFSVDIASGADR